MYSCDQHLYAAKRVTCDLLSWTLEPAPFADHHAKKEAQGLPGFSFVGHGGNGAKLLRCFPKHVKGCYCKRTRMHGGAGLPFLLAAHRREKPHAHPFAA